jgi:hypothetical protein
MANAYSQKEGIGVALRSEESEHNAVRKLKLLMCPRSSELALWRINSKWRHEEHFAHLKEIFGWVPTPRQFSAFASASGRWKEKHSDFAAALTVYLRDEKMTTCPFHYVDEVRIETLIGVLNASGRDDQLSTVKLRVILDVYRKSAKIFCPDDFSFINMLIENHKLDKQVALKMEELWEDFLAHDLGL